MEKIAKEIANFYAYQIKGWELSSYKFPKTGFGNLQGNQAAVYRIYQQSPVQAS